MTDQLMVDEPTLPIAHQECETASYTRRFAALILDFSFAGAMASVLPLGVIYNYILPQDFISDFFSSLCRLELIAFVFAYFVLSRYYNNGQTPAKKILGIRTQKLDGSKLRFWEASLDSLGYVWLGFDILGFFFSSHGQRFTQMIIKTKVVRVVERPLV